MASKSHNIVYNISSAHMTLQERLQKDQNVLSVIFENFLNSKKKRNLIQPPHLRTTVYNALCYIFVLGLDFPVRSLLKVLNVFVTEKQ